MAKNKPEHLEVMAKGCMNDRVRIVFWDKHDQNYVAVTPEYLVKHGVPFNGKSEKFLEYNSTHLSQ